MKVNFYGGCHDGETYEVPLPLPATYRLPVKPAGPGPVVSLCDYELREVYCRAFGRTFVYVAAEMADRFGGLVGGTAFWNEEKEEAQHGG